jgi:cysteine desulfurase
VNGHPSQRLPNNLNLSFGQIEGEALLMSMSDVAVSTGAACNSAGSKTKGSHVLQATGLADSLIQSSIRFGLGRFTTEEEVEYVKGRVVESVRGLRELAPRHTVPMPVSTP